MNHAGCTKAPVDAVQNAIYVLLRGAVGLVTGRVIGKAGFLKTAYAHAEQTYGRRFMVRTPALKKGARHPVQGICAVRTGPHSAASRHGVKTRITYFDHHRAGHQALAAQSPGNRLGLALQFSQ
jgi:hypothetical protein